MKNYFFVRHDNQFVKVHFHEIIYVEACKNYVKIVTAKKSRLILISLSQLEQLLPSIIFCRIHRSYIVSLDYVDSFDHDSVFLKDITLPVGNFYWSRLKKSVRIVSDTRQQEIPPISDDMNMN